MHYFQGGNMQKQKHTIICGIFCFTEKSKQSMTQRSRVSGTLSPTCCHFGFPWLQDLERPDVLKWESGYSSLQDSQAGFEEKCV
jgi:hypothetical protein